jgi:ATP synthase protein I
MNKSKSKLQELKSKINQLQIQEKSNHVSSKNKTTGFGFRISIEIVAALVVGVGIGIIVDNYFNSQPFGLIIFFILGALAGFLNVYRVMRRIEKQ